MKGLNFAVEQYQWNDNLNRQIWVVVEVYAHKIDALDFIDGNSDEDGMFKISEVYGEIDY